MYAPVTLGLNQPTQVASPSRSKLALISRSVPDSTFVFRPRPGSLKMTGRVAIQAQPGGLDHLDDVAHWVEGHAPVSRPPARPAIPIIMVAFLPALIFIVACEIRRRRAAKPPAAAEHPL